MNKTKIILCLGAMLMLMAVAGELLLGVIFPGYVGKAHLVAPPFFFVLYAVSIAVAAKPTDAQHFLKQYMAFKTMKLMTLLTAMLAFGFLFREQAKGVLVNFLIYSLVMIVVENVYVLYSKKRMANK